MILRILRLGFVLLAVLLAVWFLHQQYFISNDDNTYNLLTPAYWVNYLLGIGVFSAVLLAHRHQPMIAGYVFLGGSLLKFLVFFLFFYPFFNNDGDLSRGEFAIFFIPYIVTLSTTVIATARALNTD